jgi:flagellar protein FliS
MFPVMNNLRQLQAYRDNQLTTTDPGTVLLMLYQGAIDAIKQAKIDMASGNMASKGKEILRATDIINQFIASLDYEVGGDLAHNLEALYRYMLEQLLAANAYNDHQALDTVLNLLVTLKSGWDEAVVAQRKKAAQGNYNEAKKEVETELDMRRTRRANG